MSRLQTAAYWLGAVLMLAVVALYARGFLSASVDLPPLEWTVLLLLISLFLFGWGDET